MTTTRVLVLLLVTLCLLQPISGGLFQNFGIKKHVTKKGPAAAAPPTPTPASKKTTMKKTKTTSSSSSKTKTKNKIQKSKTKKTSTEVKKKIDLGKYKGITTEVRRFLAASKSLPPRFLQSQLRLILVPHANDPNFMKLLTKLWSIKMVKKIYYADYSRYYDLLFIIPLTHTFFVSNIVQITFKFLN